VNVTAFAGDRPHEWGYTKICGRLGASAR